MSSGRSSAPTRVRTLVEPELGTLECARERLRQVEVEKPDLARRRALAVDGREEQGDLGAEIVDREGEPDDPVAMARGRIDDLVIRDLPDRDDAGGVTLADGGRLALQGDPGAGGLHVSERPRGLVDVDAGRGAIRIGRDHELALVETLGHGEPGAFAHRGIRQRPASSIGSRPPWSGPRGMIGQTSTTIPCSTTWYASK
jgi:hypothetical protein